MKSVLIVGYGTVGSNLYKELAVLKPDIYDKYKSKVSTKRSIKYDFCFICVDTPYDKETLCDLTEVNNALKENDADIYIIKSTILPGNTELLSLTYNKRIIFSPEYYGGTQHCNNFEFNFTILGGDKEDCKEVIQLLQHAYDARHTFHIVDSRTAELVKYMENSWLATKVVFCNQFNLISKQLGIDYEILRELFILDPRVNPSHTFVYRGTPYYDSHCLNKDVPAIAEYTNNEFLQKVIEINEKFKEVKDKIND